MFVGTNNIAMNFERSTRALQDEQEYLILERAIPRQIQQGSSQEAVQEVASAATDSSKIFIIGNFIFNLLISASLNQLLTLINT